MLNTKTFSDILQDFSQTDDAPKAATATWNAGWESVLDPSYMAQIMADSQLEQLQSLLKPKFRGYKQRPSPTINREAATVVADKEQAQRTPHSMTEIQKQAFNSLLKWAPLLSPAFELGELKSAYRRAMLKTHPDHGGHSESFQEAKKSYHILLALVK